MMMQPGGGAAPPHHVRRFRLADDFLSNRSSSSISSISNKVLLSPPVVMRSGSTTTTTTSAAATSAAAHDASSSSNTLDWALLVETAFAVYLELGDGCSERTYQKRLYYDLYCLGVPCIIERPVHTTTQHGMTLGKGRVDLEVARRFVLELKVTLPTEKNVRRDKRQLLRYLTTYQEQGLQMERAALVYFSNNEVRVVEVSTAPRARNTFVPRNGDAGGSAYQQRQPASACGAVQV